MLYLEDRSVTKKVPEGPRNTLDDVLDEWPASVLSSSELWALFFRFRPKAPRPNECGLSLLMAVKI